MSDAAREMTLAEWVDRLPPIHGARAEYSALIAAAERADAAEKRVRELEEALKEIGRCDLDRRPWLLAECGAGDNKIFCPKCEADMILSANNIWKCPNCEEPRP